MEARDPVLRERPFRDSSLSTREEPSGTIPHGLNTTRDTQNPLVFAEKSRFLSLLAENRHSDPPHPIPLVCGGSTSIVRPKLPRFVAPGDGRSTYPAEH